ncbi:SapC family protein [Piscinibacter sakaiensis]|uniref:SapC family protein n=1 Tax=Piscinibacter sakaiensis TaxID=1547922 RepID=UPI003AAC2455
MTNQSSPIYREPVQLNAQLHRHKRLKPLEDHSLLGSINAVYLNVVEFAPAAQSFPIIFVPPTTAQPQVTPMAMLGLVAKQNLFVEDGRWDASYVPAFFRRLPYLTAPLPGTDQIGVYIDMQWPGLNDTDGEPLFTPEGEQAPALSQAIEFLKSFDEEAKRTSQICARLNEMELFTPMKADVKLPDGETLTIEGFMIIDEAKLAELPDAKVLELHRSGALGVIHAHLVSLNQVNNLIQRQARRAASSAPSATATA